MEVLIMAFLVGLGGSLHCVGMCGPLQLALHGNQGLSFNGFGRQLLYHSGRITTYAVFGGITGLLGQTIKIAGFQQSLSIFIGAFIGLGALGILGHSFTTLKWPFMDRFLMKLKKKMGTLLHKGKDTSRFALGMLNGFLPCGLVYVGLGGAMTTGSYEEGMLFMIFFGLGTLPLLLGISFLGSILKPALRNSLKPAMLGITLVFSVLLILRGLNLDIPYLSPQLSGPVDEITVCNE
ncbi:MAG: sulfite exporter TauE/SafE family protein [Bacteroidota bacterium]